MRNKNSVLCIYTAALIAICIACGIYASKAAKVPEEESAVPKSKYTVCYEFNQVSAPMSQALLAGEAAGYTYNNPGQVGMTASNFVKILKHIATLKTIYHNQPNWSQWSDKGWQFDCILMPKSILYWGWHEDKNQPHGGAQYNAKYDFTEEGFLNHCTNVSTDFSSILPGELLYKEGHVGFYIGDGKVVEATVGWNAWKVVISDITVTGRRILNGIDEEPWICHGRIPEVVYDIKE